MNYLFLDSAPAFLLLIKSMPLTLLLLGMTIFTSVQYMQLDSRKHKFMFVPYEMKRKKQWYRFFSYGLVHGDWLHLGFNMYALFLFGGMVEQELSSPNNFGVLGGMLYLALYLSGLVMSSVYSYYKHQDNQGYSALGASGAISGLVFASVLLAPMNELGLIIFPNVYFPAVFFGLAYLAYSAYMSKRNMDNIGHDAHYWGGIWGFIFLLPFKPSLFLDFLTDIQIYCSNMF